MIGKNESMKEGHTRRQKKIFGMELREERAMEGLSQKIYLELTEPTEEDNRSSWERIQDALQENFGETDPSPEVLQTLYPCCENSGWKVTVSLVFTGQRWRAVRLEEGNTADSHYGYCADLGSTTVVMRMINCGDGACLGQVSVNNHQIAYGADILTRIFYCKDQPEHLKELTAATRESFLEAMELLHRKTGIGPEQCLCMTVAGNAAMMHFFYGMDPFCVFSSPYALRSSKFPAFSGKELGLPVCGMIFSYPARANYLGGDIVSGVLASGLDRQEEIGVFLDIGTNGELVIGNREFLICGAGAAGPALEGGVVKTGMRAEPGAVSYAKITDGKISVTVIGDQKAKGICGSGIVDLLAELFLHGWIDIRGKFLPEASEMIQWQEKEQEFAVEYAPGLLFYQSDIAEFIKTKAAAHTMVEYLMRQVGLTMEEIGHFHVAGAFGTYIDKESAVAVGLYPDIDRERIVSEGNASLEGAQYWLLHRSAGQRTEEILGKMEYVQFGAVDDFLHLMVAAEALPHTDLKRYPTIEKRLRENGILQHDF